MAAVTYRDEAQYVASAILDKLDILPGGRERQLNDVGRVARTGPEAAKALFELRQGEGRRYLSNPSAVDFVEGEPSIRRLINLMPVAPHARDAAFCKWAVSLSGMDPADQAGT
jgi:hypothetical protein